MPSFFISHANADREAAERVGARLRRQGFGAYVSSDPRHGPAAGAKWEEDIYDRLRGASAVVFLASEASVASRWCFAELALARSEGKPIFPILVDEAVRHPLIDDVQWIELRRGDDGFEQLWEGIRRAGIDPRVELSWDLTRAPYPGLEAFQPGDAAVFFGRTEEVTELVERVRARGRGRLLTVVGGSGTGKSSLVRAGLVPRLEREHERWVILPPLEPGRDPLEDLARALAVALAAAGRTEDWRTVKERLGAAPRALVELARDLCDTYGSGGGSVLLVVDQAEGLLTHADGAGRARFARVLREATEAPTPLHVVATLRSEFLARAGEGDSIVDRSELFLLGPLDRSRLPEVVEGPARNARIDFDAGLVTRIVDDTRGGDALPLLAHTLRQLYEHADRAGGKRRFSHELYDRLGGVAGALTTTADGVQAQLAQRGEEAAMLPTLLKLVEVDAEGEVTRRRVHSDELTSAEREIVRTFVEHRLLKTDRLDDATVVVEVVHEALLREWRPLREHVERSRDQLRLVSELRRLSREWNAAARAASYLLRGDRLARARHAVAAADGGDLAQVHELVDASLAAERDSLERESDLLARSAREVVDEDPELAVLLAAAAVEEYAPTVAAVWALAWAISASKLRGRLEGHEGLVRGAAYSPDGTRIVTCSEDGTARVWDSATGAAFRTLRGHEGGVWSVAWSPDGTRIVTSSADETARVWDAAGGAELRVLRGHGAWVGAVAWSPEGSRILTGSTDGTARVWDAATGAELRVVRGHEAPRRMFETVLSVAWSPDGSRIVTGSGDRTARVWDAASGVALQVLRGHDNVVAAVAWSPDGSRIVTGSHDRTARVWDAVSGAELQVLRGHHAELESVAYTPEGEWILTGSDDGTVGVWDAARGTARQVLRGHRGGVWSVGCSPDGSRVVTGSRDATACIWEPASAGELFVLRGHEGSVGCVACSPDGREIVTGSADGTVRCWDAATGEQLRTLRGAEDVWSVACSPDGSRIVAGSYDGTTVRLWSRWSGKALATVRRDKSWAVSLAYSPDGARIVAGSHDGVVRVLDASLGAEFRVVQCHRGGVSSIAWSPDGGRILTGSGDATACVLDAISGAELEILSGHMGSVLSVAWSPDGGRILTGSDDRTARVWDAASGSVLRVLEGHADAVTGVAWSRDGGRILTGSFDYTGRVWDARTGDVILDLRGHTGAVADVAWSPDGTRIVTASWDGKARVWEDATPEGLVVKAKTRVFRSLTRQERASYGLPAEPR